MEPLSIASDMHLGREVIALDLYAALGVSVDARPEEIRRAYRRRVRENHPDLHPGDASALARMREVNLAGRVLLDPALRAAYDRGQRERREQKKAEPRAWWSRASADSECEWVAPPPTARARPTPESLRWFFGDLRGRTAQALVKFDDFLIALTPERRLALGSLSIGLALLLLAAASTRMPGGERPRPVSVSPTVLYP